MKDLLGQTIRSLHWRMKKKTAAPILPFLPSAYKLKTASFSVADLFFLQDKTDGRFPAAS